MKDHLFLLGVACLVGAGAVACAKVHTEPEGSGGRPGLPGTGGGSGSSSGSGTGGIVALPDGGPVEKFVDEVAICKQVEYMFEPKIPTVTLLVDRSGSMFHCLSGNTGDAVCADLTNTAWAKLRTAIESVMTQLDAQVRFGFMTVWGTNPASNGMCPSIKGMATDAVPPALNNAAAITKVYDGLAPAPNSTETGKKFESPASESIAVATKQLMDDTTVGDKYIIFLTDGQPDYCDDSNSLCAPDSVIFRLQTAYTAGIKTVVFGVQTALFDLAPGVLQAFANAGAGEPTLAPVRTGGTANDLWDQCNGLAPWADDLTASGKPKERGTTLGTYSTAMGPTKPYMPSAANQTELVNQLSSALSGVKSCTFDLKEKDGNPLKVDRTMLTGAHVKIMGTEVPLDETNGWRMNTESQLELTGKSCDTWRAPESKTVDFMFPCEAFIVG